MEEASITFIVSGKVKFEGPFNTYICLNSIRRFYPQAKIILSTWENTGAERFTDLCDKLILSSPPQEKLVETYLKGCDWGRGKINTINMQQKSVHVGLRATETDWAVRLRTDFLIVNNCLIPFYVKWNACLDSYDFSLRVFRERILVYRVSMVNPRLESRKGLIYQISDTFQFGRTEDLLKLWDGHYESIDSLNYFTLHPESGYDNPHQFNHRYSVEQYMTLNVLKKYKIPVHIPEYYNDTSPLLLEDSERFFASNIIIGDSGQCGVASKFKDHNFLEHYTSQFLLECYLKYIDNKNQAVLRYLKKNKLWFTLKYFYWRNRKKVSKAYHSLIAH